MGLSPRVLRLLRAWAAGSAGRLAWRGRLSASGRSLGVGGPSCRGGSSSVWASSSLGASPPAWRGRSVSPRRLPPRGLPRR
eukprot:6348940-Alexandrium_andersonii.AAC.1